MTSDADPDGPTSTAAGTARAQPRVFLCYSSSEKRCAERIELELRQRGYAVFFAPASLPAGRTYHAAIQQSIEAADLFVFLVSPDAVRTGSYTLTELEIAARKWSKPDGRVLPVQVKPIDKQTVPPYLLAVSMLEPAGDVTAAVAEAVQKLVDGVVPGWGRNDGLRQRAEQLAHRMRDFLRAAESQEQHVVGELPRVYQLGPEDPYLLQIRREEARQRARWALQAKHASDWREVFLSEAVRIRDEIVGRVHLDRSAAPTYEDATYPAGVVAIADDLEQLAAALPP